MTITANRTCVARDSRFELVEGGLNCQMLPMTMKHTQMPRQAGMDRMHETWFEPQDTLVTAHAGPLSSWLLSYLYASAHYREDKLSQSC